MTNYASLKLKIVIIFIIGFVLFPAFIFGAELYLEPLEGEYHQGDTFIVEARIDAKEKCVNAIEARLTFPGSILEVRDISKGNSIISVWLKEPEFSNEQGLVFFSGGIPGGYCGRIPGDPGESNLLARIIFQVRETDAKLIRETDAKLEFLEGTQVLLNDGLGTPTKLTTKGAVFTILTKPFDAAQGMDEWLEEIAKDKIPPEPFEIEIRQDPTIFDGEYFIIFSTADKQTGIDRYELKEKENDWKKVESPYLLEDQELESIIKVRAIDKAGNEQLAEYVPEISKKLFPYWLIVFVLVGIGVVWRQVKSRKLKVKSQS